MEYVIISRHQATISWIQQQMPETVGATIITGNATPDDVRNKVVVGNVPMALAALATKVVAVEFDGQPPRGTEYGAKELAEAGARLTGYVVRRA